MSHLLDTITARPEEELLLCCARMCAQEERTDAITSLLNPEVNWSYLLQIAARHRMVPRLHKHLNTVCPHAVPRHTQDQLRVYSRNNTVRNLYLTHELLRLLQLFAAHDIPAAPFKGPVLAAVYYGDVALREFEDLDILVHEQDVPNARRLLLSKHYRPQFELNDQQEANYLKSHHALSFEHVERSIMVDLHWAITPANLTLASDPEWLWKHLQAVSVLGTTIRTLSPEDLLLVLCVHGTKHRWEYLSWICDVAFLLHRHTRMDWDRVFNQAAKHGSEGMLFLGLFLVRELLGVRLLKEVSKRIQVRAVVEPLARQVVKNLFRNRDILPGRFEGYTFYLRAMDRFRDKFRHCYLELIPTPLEWSLLRLPAYLYFLYYLLRPMRLVGKHTLKFARHVFTGIRRANS